ncbi:MAG: hypothetical protein U0746_20610 [Gemmataceae bacterium]
MPLTCPVCRAANDAGPTCRRCRADLSLCFAVERQSDAALAAARAALAQGDVARACSLAGRAAGLRRRAEATRVRAAAALLAGDFAAAWCGRLKAGSEL